MLSPFLRRLLGVNCDYYAASQSSRKRGLTWFSVSWLPNTRYSSYSFRVTGITRFLEEGSAFEVAQHMADHQTAGRLSFTTNVVRRYIWKRWGGFGTELRRLLGSCMKLREVTIRNFRCLVDVTVPLDDSVVLIGENNSGKTAFLDALRLALPRTQPGKSVPFHEYDYHMAQSTDSLKTNAGIVIELLFREDLPDQWPDALIQALEEIVQIDPANNLNSIRLRVTSKYDEVMTEMVPKWEFLNFEGHPLAGKAANPAHVGRFLSYIRVFYLSALRDADQEFSSRSQFWGRILRDLKIDDAQRKVLQTELEKLNTSLLASDPRLEQVRTAMENLRKVLTVELGQGVAIEALPLQPWDLMSKAQLVIKPCGSQVSFPLNRHGQGMQSLAVLFLFQAYIDVLLKPTFQQETEAILTLEEPEAHLHPHAARALAAILGEMKTQKITSSHSPYFVQEVPFADIRMFRKRGASSKVLYLRQSFSRKIPNATELRTFVNKKPGKFSYDAESTTLSVMGRMQEEEYRDLIQLYPNQSAVQQTLKQLRDESMFFLSKTELADLDTYAKRIRGEVLFARGWILCEGQSEYLLIRYFAELLSLSLDSGGITVIDFQNNGSIGAFVGLTRVFEIPWIMFCDNDRAGQKFVREAEARGLTQAERMELIRLIPEGMDFETFLSHNGFAQEYAAILNEREMKTTKNVGDGEYEDKLAEFVKKDKIGATRMLIQKLQASNTTVGRVPVFFKTLIQDIFQKVS